MKNNASGGPRDINGVFDEKSVGLSVIVPCYNAEDCLPRCVESLLGQATDVVIMPESGLGGTKVTLQFEIILVNDASTDNTWGVACELEKRHPDQIVAVGLPENMRQGGARNVGLSYATGEYVGFVDSDDWVEPDMYARMYREMARWDCDFVQCSFVRDFGNGETVDAKAPDRGRFLLIDTDEKREALIVSRIVDAGAWSKLYKREFLEKNELRFLERMAYEDIHWGAMLRLYARRVFLMSERLYHYYVNPSSTVMKKNATYHEDLKRANLAVWGDYVRLNALDRYGDALKFDFLMSFYIAGVKMLSLRYDEPPYDAFYEMQGIVRELVPDYRENPYLKGDVDELYLLLIGLIDQPLSHGQVDQVFEVARKMGL